MRARGRRGRWGCQGGEESPSTWLMVAFIESYVFSKSGY